MVCTASSYVVCLKNNSNRPESLKIMSTKVVDDYVVHHLKLVA